MYADVVTKSMKLAIDETNRRRKLQREYNDKNGIKPETISKSVRDVIEATKISNVAEDKEDYKFQIGYKSNLMKILIRV